MALHDLVPFRHRRRNVAVGDDGSNYPIFALQRRMNRLFDDFFKGFDFDIEPFGQWGSSSFVPKLNLSEDDKEVTITAELPGVDEKELELSIANNTLTIKGEKKSESEDKGKGYCRIERAYGSFSRTVLLPDDIDEDKAEAEMKKGVLTIRIPKTAGAQSARKKIEIKSE